eukprot:756010-Prorocentrum_minimum.AAC.2
MNRFHKQEYYRPENHHKDVQDGHQKNRGGQSQLNRTKSGGIKREIESRASGQGSETAAASRVTTATTNRVETATASRVGTAKSPSLRPPTHERQPPTPESKSPSPRKNLSAPAKEPEDTSMPKRLLTAKRPAGINPLTNRILDRLESRQAHKTGRDPKIKDDLVRSSLLVGCWKCPCLVICHAVPEPSELLTMMECIL